MRYNKQDEYLRDSSVHAVRRSHVTGGQLALFLLAIIVAFIAGTRYDYVWSRLTNITSPAGVINLNSVQSLYKELARKYDGNIDKEKLIEGAKHGLVNAIGDPYTVYFTAKETEEFNNDLEGTFDGIGAELSKREARLTIIATIDNSPASTSGLRSGDVILKVNDEDAVKWSVEEAVSKIRGPKGTSVKLLIARDKLNQPLEISVVRDTIKDPSVKREITTDGIGIMRISRFANGVDGLDGTSVLARQAALYFKEQKVKGVIVDLRGNGGGYLDASAEIASLWMHDKVVVTQRTAGKVVSTTRTKGEALLEGIPTIVLVNEASASASEILAAALQDNNAAHLVGEKTFGKGVVQEVLSLADGGSLKVTVASWYSPNGKNISKEGITPSTVVSMTDEDYAVGRDPQKDKALELLR
ncbi:MAG: S41 family peptidase [Candidatus Saccharimonadales bacterium]